VIEYMLWTTLVVPVLTAWLPERMPVPEAIAPETVSLLGSTSTTIMVLTLKAAAGKYLVVCDPRRWRHLKPV